MSESAPISSQNEEVWVLDMVPERGRDQSVRTSYQVFIQTIHGLHVFRYNVKVIDFRIFHDPFLSDTLGKGNIAVLQ